MDTTGQFQWYADWVAAHSPLYERLARRVPAHPELRAIAVEAGDGQPAPQLLFGAVHSLLLDGRCPSLASFYETCTARPADPIVSDPVPPFRACCRSHEERLREMIASRSVQTNAVGRSAVLLPAFEYVRRVAGGPLSLVEVGASAGLNLRWDRYRYAYTGAGTRANCGDPESPVRVETEVRGDRMPPVPESPPSVAHRVGIDLNPLDVTDERDARWLRALVIPDQTDRHERLAAAVAAARADPPPLVAGDALDVLPSLLDDVPAGTTRCVFSTHTLYQLEAGERRELRSLLSEASHERPVHWLTNDPAADTDAPTFRHVRFVAGEATERRLSTYESYGAWLRWHAEDLEQ